MSTANTNLKNVLKAIKKEKNLETLHHAASSLLADEWNEIDLRANFFLELRTILLAKPIEINELRSTVKASGNIVLGGFGGFKAQIRDFLNHDQANLLINNLLSDDQVVPDQDVIDKFIDDTVKFGFHNPGGKSKNWSGAALFTSVLLTAAFPDHFVDFRHGRWHALATNFNLELPGENAKYSERLFWAGRIAKELASTSTFKEYFNPIRPDNHNWTVSGLTYLFNTDEILKQIVEEVTCPNGEEGVNDIQVSAEKIWEILQKHNPQIILQGPPGSGKTYLAEQVIRHLAKSGDLDSYRLSNLNHDDENSDWLIIWDLVQFHPSYGYEDFVRGLATVPTEKGIEFKAQNRILAEAAEAASKNPSIPVVLILDEINRADLSRVLGELIYVLERDRRGQPVSTQYAVGNPPDRTLRLPPNLYFIATMNTADRSIALVDYAIRRRFSFFSVLPSVEVVEEFYSTNQYHQGDQKIADQWSEKIPQLYQAVSDIFDSVPDADDIRIGHSYFMVKGFRDSQKLSQEDWADAVAFRFAYEVIPMLNEYHKERKLRSNQDEITINEYSFSLQLTQQRATYEKVKAWLME